MELKFEYQNHSITASGEENWHITDKNGIKTSRTAVLALNPSLARKIDANVKEKIDEIERAKKREAKKAKEKFEAQVKAVRLSGITIELTEDNRQTVNLWKETSKKGKVSAQVYYDENVWSSESLHLHKTNNVWVVYFDYKNVRYKTLDKALKKAAEKINLRVANKEALYEAHLQTQARDADIAGRLLAYELQLKKERVRCGSDYKVGYLLKSTKNKNYNWHNTAEVWGDIWLSGDTELEKREITKIQIKGKMTLKGMSILAALLKDLVSNGDLKVDL
jgi:peptidyl-tRNA hydrolase